MSRNHRTDNFNGLRSSHEGISRPTQRRRTSPDNMTRASASPGSASVPTPPQPPTYSHPIANAQYVPPPLSHPQYIPAAPNGYANSALLAPPHLPYRAQSADELPRRSDAHRSPPFPHAASSHMPHTLPYIPNMTGPDPPPQYALNPATSPTIDYTRSAYGTIPLPPSPPRPVHTGYRELLQENVLPTVNGAENVSNVPAPVSRTRTRRRGGGDMPSSSSSRRRHPY